MHGLLILGLSLFALASLYLRVAYLYWLYEAGGITKSNLQFKVLQTSFVWPCPVGVLDSLTNSVSVKVSLVRALCNKQKVL